MRTRPERAARECTSPFINWQGQAGWWDMKLLEKSEAMSKKSSGRSAIKGEDAVCGSLPCPPQWTLTSPFSQF